MLLLPYAALLAAFVSAERGHFKLDFDVSSKGNSFVKRQGGLAEISLAETQDYYMASLEVGSNNTPIKVVLDTSTSGLVVMEKNVDCWMQRDDDDQWCSYDGTFDPSASTTFEEIPDVLPLNSWYGEGFYGIDSVAVGAVKISQCIFGVANISLSSGNFLGIGLPENNTGFSAPNFPLVLKSAGVTEKNVYSLYLNSEEAQSGSVLFGAVDHNKYSGTLQTVPLINPHPELYARPSVFQIVLNSMTLQGPEKSVTLFNAPIQASFLSSFSIMQLPEDMVGGIIDTMLGSYNDSVLLYQVSCDYMTSIDSMLFNFSGALISVPFSDLVYFDGSFCFLEIEPIESSASDGPIAVLGANFLRHAYVVFDLEEYEISLAQVKYESSENIEIVTSTIPRAVKAKAYSATSLASSVAIALGSTGIIQTGPAPSSMVHTSTESSTRGSGSGSSIAHTAAATSNVHSSAATSIVHSFASSFASGVSSATASSAPSTGTKVSSGIRSTCVRKIVLYAAVCAGLVAYF